MKELRVPLAQEFLLVVTRAKEIPELPKILCKLHCYA